ncbi:family 20 glycosylhydrolase [Alteromonadaceae bacterium BrNp21-10]|nr:family 20 glycosylhydrolase [Alteromonadaceae bacterium BrNp21-10]
MMIKNLLPVVACGVLVSCSQPTNTALTQATLNQIANDLDVSVAIIDNVGSDKCQTVLNVQQCYEGEITLTFDTITPTSDWAIYFSHVSPILWDGSEEFDITRINGDLHKISLKSGHIEQGKPYVIPFLGPNWIVSESEIMPNFMMVADNLQARTISSTKIKIDQESQLPIYPHIQAFTTEQQQKRSKQDNTPLATPEYLYQVNQRLNSQPVAYDNNRIIPKIQSAQWQAERVSLKDGLKVSASNQQHFAAAVTQFNQANIAVSTDKGIPLELMILEDSELSAQGYELDIQPQAITITAADNDGFFYGLTSLAQLVSPDDLSLPTGNATDAPRYNFRGVHIDVARNFHSKDFVLSVIEQMAKMKLNKLHLHLADDEGWRLEIPGLPELTEVGAFRCFDTSEQQCLLPQLGNGAERSLQVNGYYSVEDYKDIVKYAAQRAIEVIPALDMPGHSRAAVKAMLARYNKYFRSENQQLATEFLLTEFEDKSQYSSIQHYNDNTLNPCIDSTYNFVGKILDEVINMHAEAGVPLKRYHIGADETAGAWKDSPTCQALISEHADTIKSAEHLTAYFVERVANMVSDKGLIAGAWSDGLSHVDAKKLPANIQSNIWDSLPGQGHNRAHQHINNGWDTILSIPDVMYFDFPYQTDSKETGYYWGSRYTDTFQVFQFMPDNLPAHAEFWKDTMGNDYSSKEDVTINDNLIATGIQAQLWSETVRSDEMATYMLFPRLLALAERAWHKPEWALPYSRGQSYSATSAHFTEQLEQQQLADWYSFSQTLVKKWLPQLAQSDVFFRLPTPGATIIDGILHANANFNDLNIEYRLADGEWQQYTQPVEVSGTVELRHQLAGLERRGRIVTVH